MTDLCEGEGGQRAWMLAMVMPVRELAIEAAKASSDSVACAAARLFAELLCC